MTKEELYEKVVEVRMVSDKVMTLVVVYEQDVLRLTRGYSPQSGRSLEEKQSFYDELKCEWDMHYADDLVMCLGDLNGHIGRHVDGIHGGYGVGQRNLEGRMSLQFCLEENRKVTLRIGENETEIDFVFTKKEHRRHIQNVKAIHGEFQHALVIADI